LAYFGDELKEGCGNCDTCLEPVKTWDGTLAAQQALSCIYRTEQRFGVNYLIDVLLGKSNERIISFGHNKQSTFGIGKDLDERQWRSVFRQLVAKGYVEIDYEGYGAFKLTEQCRPVLRGEQALMLRKDSEPVKGSGKVGGYRAANKSERNALWEALKTKRQEMADDQNVPPFFIFHDATLMAMMEKKPTSLRQMGTISGVGVKKLERYGDKFLEVLLQFSDLGLTDTVGESVELFRLGYSIKKIATTRGLSEGTIYTHLSQAIGEGSVMLTDVIDLDVKEIEQIEDAIINLPDDKKNALKPLFDLFEEAYSYDILRCVRAGFQVKTG
jgi:ATP-dependent DNA helicase RecQ